MQKLLITIMLFLLPTPIVFAQAWVKEKNKDGITIWTKSVSNYAMKMSRAEMMVSSDLEKSVDAVFNIDNYPKWMPDCAHSEVIKQSGSNSLIYHAIYDTPWPAASRDLVIQIDKKQTKEGYKIIMTNKSNYIEVVPDAVRIPIYFGEWRFITSPKGTKIIVEFQTDPGGSVPDWMIQGAAVKSPYVMFESLREYLRK